MIDMKDINSVEDLDNFLLNEISPEEEVDTEIVEAVDAENTDNADLVEETPQAVEEQETSPTQDEDQVAKATANNKFAEMRYEASENRRRADEAEAQLNRERELISNIARQSGFQTTEEFQLAFQKQVEAKERADLGLDEREYEQYKGIKEGEVKLHQREQMLQQREYELKSKDLGYQLLEVSKTTNIPVEKIYEKLDASGVTPQNVIESGMDFNTFLQGALMEDIIEARVNDRLAKPETVVDTKPLDTTHSADNDLDIDKLIADELKEYAKNL